MFGTQGLGMDPMEAAHVDTAKTMDLSPVPQDLLFFFSQESEPGSEVVSFPRGKSRDDPVQFLCARESGILEVYMTRECIDKKRLHLGNGRGAWWF